jgi:hypothetical protein
VGEVIEIYGIGDLREGMEIDIFQEGACLSQPKFFDIVLDGQSCI